MNIKFADQELYLDENSIFLAGPTRRNSPFDISWRKEACDILENLGFDGTVYIPELLQEDKFDNEDYSKQTKWEWACLEVAGAILFWVPRNMKDMPALTTNIEFGRYMAERPDHVVLGYPSCAEKMQYLDLYYREKTGRIPAGTLEDTLKEALERLAHMRHNIRC